MTKDTNTASGTAELASRLRNACTSVRSKSHPLSDLIPLMQQAADALAPSPAQPVAEPAKNDTAYADCICANCGDDKAQHNGSRCVNGEENSYFAAQQPGTAQTDSVLDDACYAPPLGWRCTRKAGHEGPCAAVAYEDDKLFVERGMQRIRDAEDAARYRWLREQPFDEWKRIAWHVSGRSPTICADRDAAIDAAIVARKEINNE